MNFTAQTILYIAVIFTCSSPSCTNSLPLEKKESNQQSRDQQTHHQDDASQPENIKQDEATSSVKGFLDAPSAHNRTTRDAYHNCVEKIVRDWDSCRQREVNTVVCLSSHTYCNQFIAPPKCKPVYGYLHADSGKRCPVLPINCQCAL